jgi:hypothetical protein
MGDHGKVVSLFLAVLREQERTLLLQWDNNAGFPGERRDFWPGIFRVRLFMINGR